MTPLSPGPRHLQTVFVVVMENANWSAIHGSPSAPYLNGLLATAARSEQHYNPRGVHPSEPNYLWMEAGTDFGVRDDLDPSAHHFANTDHLVSMLGKAAVSWKSYQEDIAPGECPTSSHGLYAAKHNPFVFFDDVLPQCAVHIRPLSELEADLQSGALARYNFVTPNLCNDMHGASGCPTDLVKAGDDFLALWIPRILATPQYKAGGVVFVTWDEGEPGDGPIGMIAVSPFAKPGYASTVRTTHSSLLRSLQEIFAVGPLLCDAANAADLSDLFTAFP